MAKKVELWKTSDGKLWENEGDADTHEELLGFAARCRHKFIPKHIDDTNFSNGGGYIKLTAAAVAAYEAEVLAEVARRYPDLANKPLRSYGVGRTLCDSDSPLYSAVSLLSQIDNQNRLWGQPYFALNPTKGEQSQLHEVR